MAGARGTKHTGLVEGIQTLAADVTNLLFLPDAQNPQVQQLLQGLQQAIVKIGQQLAQVKAQQAAHMQQLQAAHAAGGVPGMGQRPPMPGQPGGPPSQGMPGIAMPNPDEMRRVLASAGGGG